ncbi:hypothetical protein FKM82_031008, partial [Ascaphus truei]
MANTGLQMLGFALACLGWIGFMVSVAIPQWKMSSFSGDAIITAQVTYEGLWMSCVMQSTGQMQCKTFDSLLKLDSTTQATRALMICGIIAGFFAVCISAVGMKCLTCLQDDEVKKAKVGIVGGVLFIIAALCVLIANSLVWHRIAQAFYNCSHPATPKYEFGPALFIGWAAACVWRSWLVLCLCALLSQEETNRIQRQEPTNKRAPPAERSTC